MLMRAFIKIKYTNLRVIVDDVDNLEKIENDIKKLGYNTQSEAGSAEEIKKQSMQVTLILGGIGSVAFIVSAIGIINTMLMSIYERQKEIGVMKVIGASVNDVRSLFLIESGFIGFFGGILGLLWGRIFFSSRSSRRLHPSQTCNQVICHRSFKEQLNEKNFIGNYTCINSRSL